VFRHGNETVEHIANEVDRHGNLTNRALALNVAEAYDKVDKSTMLMIKNRFDVLGETGNLDGVHPLDVLQAVYEQAPTFAQYSANRDRRVTVHPRPIVLENAATNTERMDNATSTDDLDEAQDLSKNRKADTSFFTQPDFSDKAAKKKARATVRVIRASAKLTYFLKCKHAFTVRTPSLLAILRADARVWMAAHDYRMESEFDYQMLMHAVLAAYTIDELENKAVAMHSRAAFYNTASVFNDAMRGKVEVEVPGAFCEDPDKLHSLRGKPVNIFCDKTVTLNYSDPTSKV
jgi:hypothetical protein